MGSGIRDVSVKFGAHVATFALGIALQSCLAWFLGPEGRGSYAVCIMYTMLLGVICTFGVDGAAQYLVASKNLSVSEGVSALLSLQAVGMVLAVGGGLLAAVYLPLEFFEKASTTSLVVAVLSAPWQMGVVALSLILGATAEFPFQAFSHITWVAVRLLLTVLFLKVIPLGVNGALGATMLAFVLGTVMVLVFLRRRYQLHWVRPKRESIRRMLSYAGRYYFAAFGMLVHFQIGTIMVAFLASERDVGLFHAGVTLITQVIVVSDVVGSVIHPRIASDPQGRPELAAQCARLVGMVCGCLVLVFVVFAKLIVAVLLSPAFLPTVPVIWILAPAVVYRAGTKVLVHYLKATDHPGIFSASTVTSVLVNFCLLLVLLPVMGLEGAAWAMAMGYYCGGTIVVWGFRKFSGLSFRESWLPQRADLTRLTDSYRMIRGKILRG